MYYFLVAKWVPCRFSVSRLDFWSGHYTSSQESTYSICQMFLRGSFCPPLFLCIFLPRIVVRYLSWLNNKGSCLLMESDPADHLKQCQKLKTAAEIRQFLSSVLIFFSSEVVDWSCNILFSPWVKAAEVSPSLNPCAAIFGAHKLLMSAHLRGLVSLKAADLW